MKIFLVSPNKKNGKQNKIENGKYQTNRQSPLNWTSESNKSNQTLWDRKLPEKLLGKLPWNFSGNFWRKFISFSFSALGLLPFSFSAFESVIWIWCFEFSCHLDLVLWIVVIWRFVVSEMLSKCFPCLKGRRGSERLLQDDETEEGKKEKKSYSALNAQALIEEDQRLQLLLNKLTPHVSKEEYGCFTSFPDELLILVFS